jgi:putative membrane protein
MKLVLHILLTALGVLLAANVVPGISVKGFGTAVLVAIVLGILNVTLGLLFKIITLPLTIVTFGIFLLIVNAFIFWMASFVKGFSVTGFGAAFFGALIVTVVNMAGKQLLKS